MSSSVDDRAAPPPGDDHEPGPPPIQFRLKTLLMLTALAAVLFATLSRVNNVLAAVLIWVSILVAGHVVGNAVGTHGRDRSRVRRHSDDDRSLYPDKPVDPRAAAAPTTTLGLSAGLGLKLFILVGCGAAVGSLVGTTLVWFHNDRQLKGPALLLAACSSAVVGAFLTFLAASCLQVWSKAWRAASRHSSKD